MGEPLLNKNLPRMIEYLNKNEIADCYEIITNASMLTHDLSKKLIDAGLSRLCVSIQTVKARVTAVKKDGKLDLSVRDKIPMQMDKDAESVLREIERRGGKLPFTDKADPEVIKQEFQMSKNAFKRAVGRLLKEEKIEITGKMIAIRKK